MADRIQIRRDLAANWVSVNPVLASGEFGLETDTKKKKLGDGVTDWNTLEYDSGGGITIDDTTPALDKVYSSQKTQTEIDTLAQDQITLKIFKSSNYATP